MLPRRNDILTMAVITAKYVEEKLATIAEDEDLSRYIL